MACVQTLSTRHVINIHRRVALVCKFSRVSRLSVLETAAEAGAGGCTHVLRDTLLRCFDKRSRIYDTNYNNTRRAKNNGCSQRAVARFIRRTCRRPFVAVVSKRFSNEGRRRSSGTNYGLFERRERF